MSSFKAIFKFEGKEYEVITCVYSLGQSVDDKGRPSSTVRGGNISLQVAASDDDTLIGWMVDPFKKSDGSIIFNKIDENSTMKELKFEQGYCVGYSESFSASSNGPMTVSLNISAKKITLGNATHENIW